MKKLLVKTLTLIIVVCFCLAFTVGCGGSSSKVTGNHKWQSDYTKDNSFHWIQCDDCEEVKDKNEHTADEYGRCTVCNGKIGATEGLVYSLSKDGSYAEVIGYNGEASKVLIAKEFKNKPVKAIGEEVFLNKRFIVEVNVPDTVTSIGHSAFSWCTGLESVIFGEKSALESIGHSAFYFCRSLKTLEIPKTVTSIGNGVFKHCRDLESVVFNDNKNWHRVESEKDWQNKVNGTAIDLSKSVTNATYFTTTYEPWFWYKKA